MYSGSSQTNFIRNPDGTHAVRCIQCQQIIGQTTAPITRATCEICQRALDGKPLPTDAVVAYNQVRDRYKNVGLLVVDDVKTPQRSKFSLKSLGGDLLEAVGIKKDKPKATKSRVLAEEKKRVGLFHDVDMGSMEDVDKKLGGEADD